MAARPLGGRSLAHSEQISHRWIPGSGDWAVYVEREATLTADLSQLESRRVRNVRLIANDLDLDLRREVAVWLRDALTQAIDATEGEAAV